MQYTGQFSLPPLHANSGCSVPKEFGVGCADLVYSRCWLYWSSLTTAALVSVLSLLSPARSASPLQGDRVLPQYYQLLILVEILLFSPVTFASNLDWEMQSLAAAAECIALAASSYAESTAAYLGPRQPWLSSPHRSQPSH